MERFSSDRFQTAEKGEIAGTFFAVEHHHCQIAVDGLQTAEIVLQLLVSDVGRAVNSSEFSLCRSNALFEAVYSVIIGPEEVALDAQIAIERSAVLKIVNVVWIENCLCRRNMLVGDAIAVQFAV